MRRTCLFLMALAALPLLAGADDPKGTLDIYFIDVMGGAATLIVTPERESILIDTGWPGLEDRDPKRITSVLKNEAKLERIDHLVTTHWHTDHFGGVEGLAKLVSIGKFWDRGLPDLSAADQDKINFPDGPIATNPLGIAYRKVTEGKRSTLKAGDRLPLRGALEARVLAASGKVVASEDSTPNPLCAAAPADMPADPSDNARSIVLQFKLGKFDFFDAGDLTWNIEKQLVCPTNVIGNSVDVYQVTHHGLDSSNHPTLIASIAPTVAIMNNGPKKGGSAATVARLREVHTIQAAYQLHKNADTGAAENTSADLIANREITGGEFIHLSVAPDGMSYTVQIGHGGTPRTFRTR